MRPVAARAGHASEVPARAQIHGNQNEDHEMDNLKTAVFSACILMAGGVVAQTGGTQADTTRSQGSPGSITQQAAPQTQAPDQTPGSGNAAAPAGSSATGGSPAGATTSGSTTPGGAASSTSSEGSPGALKEQMAPGTMQGNRGTTQGGEATSPGMGSQPSSAGPMRGSTESGASSATRSEGSPGATRSQMAPGTGSTTSPGSGAK